MYLANIGGLYQCGGWDGCLNKDFEYGLAEYDLWQTTDSAWNLPQSTSCVCLSDIQHMIGQASRLKPTKSSCATCFRAILGTPGGQSDTRSRTQVDVLTERRRPHYYFFPMLVSPAMGVCTVGFLRIVLTKKVSRAIARHAGTSTRHVQIFQSDSRQARSSCQTRWDPSKMQVH